MSARAASDDGRGASARAIIWLVLSGKPTYPLYVWWVAGQGLGPAFWSLASVAPFLAILALSRRNDAWARFGLPTLGALDVCFETKLFGATSGTELFLAACLLILALAARPGERRLFWSVAGLIAAVALGLHGRYGAPWGPWSAEEAAALFAVNLWAVAGLCAYALWRFDPAGGPKP